MKPKKRKNMTPEDLVRAQKKSTFYKRLNQSRAFADVIDGVSHPKLPYIGKDDFGHSEERTPADRLYHSARRHVEAALADFHGEQPLTSEDRALRRAARKTSFYKTSLKRLKRITEPVIEAEVARRTKVMLTTFGITGPVATPSVPVPATPVAVVKPKPPAKPAAPIVDAKPKLSKCVQCDDPVHTGKFCSMCQQRLDGIVAVLAGREPMLLSEITTACEFDEDEDTLNRLEADERFIKNKDGRWSIEPTEDSDYDYSPDPDESCFDDDAATGGTR